MNLNPGGSLNDKNREDLTDAEGDVLLEIIERFDEAELYDRDNRLEAEMDLKFLAGHQWPDDVRIERESENRPVITENRLPQFVRQVVGDMREMKPSITVLPDGDGASQDVAEIYGGMIRDIEAKAATSRPYLTAGASAARCGIGHFRIVTKYRDDDSWEQVIALEPIDDPFCVFWDPLSIEITRKDACYCFVTKLISMKAFREKYPDASTSGFDRGTEDISLMNWFNRSDETVRVAEYFRKKPVTKTLLLMKNGDTLWKEDLPAGAWEEIRANVEKSRPVQTYVVERWLTNGVDILEDVQIWPTQHIPIVAVVGEEYSVGEKRVRISAIRFARDPQRLFNYWLSTQTEHLALQPKAPFLTTAKQIGPYEDMWVRANEKNYPFLLYDADPQAPGPPQRSLPPAGSQAFTEQLMRADAAMKATTGIYEAALGAKGNEVSGKAISARQRESDVGTSEYSDNYSASVAYAGEIIVDLIPHVYDTSRQVRCLAEDGTETFADVNQMMQTPEGEQLVNALAQGKYACNVVAGPSYTTKRQEAAESLTNFVQVAPGMAQYFMDLIAKNSDWPGAKEISKRFEKMLPAKLQPPTDDPEELAERQQAAAAEQAQAALQQQMAQAELAVKMGKASVEQANAMSKKAGVIMMQGDLEKLEADTRVSNANATSIEVNTIIQSAQFQQMMGQLIADQLKQQLAQTLSQTLAVQPQLLDPPSAADPGAPQPQASLPPQAGGVTPPQGGLSNGFSPQGNSGALN